MAYYDDPSDVQFDPPEKPDYRPEKFTPEKQKPIIEQREMAVALRGPFKPGFLKSIAKAAYDPPKSPTWLWDKMVAGLPIRPGKQSADQMQDALADLLRGD